MCRVPPHWAFLFRHSEPHLGGGSYDFIRTNGILRSELEASEEWVLGLFWGTGPVVHALLFLGGSGSLLTNRQMCEGDVGLTATAPPGPSWGGMVTGMCVFICGPGVGWCVRGGDMFMCKCGGACVCMHACVGMCVRVCVGMFVFGHVRV